VKVGLFQHYTTLNSEFDT